MANGIGQSAPALAVTDNTSEESIAGKAFSARVARYRGDLYARARFLAKNDAAADDLVQEVFERALLARGRFQPGTNLRAWLISILRNLFIDWYRRAAFLAPLQNEPSWSPDDSPPGPLDLLAFDDVLAAIDRLHRSEATLFTLAYIDGISYRDIGERYDIPINTVATRLFRAKARLRQILEGVYDAKERGEGRPCLQSFTTSKDPRCGDDGNEVPRSNHLERG